MPTYSPDEVKARLIFYPEWRFENGALSRFFEFGDFLEAWSFLSQVALLAERHNHHPEIWNAYNKVRLAWTTHEAGGITEKDFTLLEETDRVYAAYRTRP